MAGLQPSRRELDRWELSGALGIYDKEGAVDFDQRRRLAAPTPRMEVVMLMRMFNTVDEGVVVEMSSRREEAGIKSCTI